MALKKHVADGSLYVWAALRISLGFIFLWAFLDKLLGLGVSTCKSAVTGAVDLGCSQSWIHGGSPTSGFLGHATSGPFADFYHKLAGHGWVDWLFMLGLLMAGVGLLFGVWVRAASLIGIVMLLLMWSALLWPANTPGIDEHIIYAIALFGVALVDENQVWGLRGWWVKTSLAKSVPFLK
jgi:thiosulfate dehydrogenase [quinone] large subunit